MRILATLLVLFGLTATSFAVAEADILIAFDNSYTDGVGGDANAEVLTANSVAASNWINEVSGTPARMRICGYHKTFNQGGRSSLGGFVGWLWNYGDGYLDDVTSAADAAGADLVAFICEPAAGEGAAAVAHQPGRYAAYGPGNFWNNVVAHESGGHNYGCDHRDGRQDPKTIMMHNYCGGGSQGWFSNPNIWLNGARLLGEGSCLGGTAHAGGDNAYQISTSAQGVADSWPRVLWGSNLSPVVHRWRFDLPAGSAPAGTTVTSSVGSAQVTVRGQGAAFTGGGLRLPGGTTGNAAADSIAAYLDLPNGTFSSMPNFTIEIWATPLSAKTWMRVIEFGRTVEAGDGLGAVGEYTGAPGSAAPGGTEASDVIGLSACTWTGSLNDQRLVTGLNGTTEIDDSALPTTAGEMHHYAITFADTAAGATVKWFRDGVLIRKRNLAFESADIEDVNVWLGRSMWSGDQMAHMEYHDIRIIGAALADGQVAGNYRVGPHDSVSTLWAGDAWNSSGFVSGAWEFGGTPSAARDYEVGTLLLRTPRTSAPVSFPGKSLKISGGDLHLNATGARTTTVADLRLNGGTIGSFGDGGSVQTLAGNITVENLSDNHIRGGWGPMTLAANIGGGSGGGSILYTESAVTLTGNNSGYRGATIVGDGRFGTLRVSSESQLGGNPDFYGGGWLQLNRGILETTSTMTVDDPNRGIMIQPSAGFLRPAAGTTLTVAVPVNSPAAGNTLQTSPMDSNPISGMFFKDGAGTLVLTHPNNSHNGEMRILDGVMRIDGAGRLNNGDHWMPVVLNSTLNVNSSATQTLRGAISGSGVLLKNNTGTLNINGSNPFTGSVTVNAGTLVANPGNAATNRAFSFVSGITVNGGGTLRSGANGLFGWDGSQARPVTVRAGGVLTTDAAGADVNVGTITLDGGTLAGFASPGWGSWNLKRVSGAKLLVTADSTVSAPNVGLGAGNSIDVAAGRTLAFSGAITDLTNEGACALVRNTGAGTLVLSGANTYTGPTTLNAGTTLVTGSLGNTVVTVGTSATFGGGGAVAGNATVNGIHAPGDGAGVQAFGGSLSYGASSTLSWELSSNSTTGHDRVDAAGAVSVAGGAAVDLVFDSPGSSVDFRDSFWTEARQWTLVEGSGLSGSFVLGDIGTDIGGRQLSDYGMVSLVHGPDSMALAFSPSGATSNPPHQQWLQANFGEDWNNPAFAGDEIDGDHDGLGNLLEYALGSDPNAFSPGDAPEISTEGGRLKIAFTRNTSATDITISVMADGDLEDPWTELARSVNGADFVVVEEGATVGETGEGEQKDVEAVDVHLIADPAHPRRFMRLVVTR